MISGVESISFRPPSKVGLRRRLPLSSCRVSLMPTAAFTRIWARMQCQQESSLASTICTGTTWWCPRSLRAHPNQYKAPPTFPFSSWLSSNHHTKCSRTILSLVTWVAQSVRCNDWIFSYCDNHFWQHYPPHLHLWGWLCSLCCFFVRWFVWFFLLV